MPCYYLTHPDNGIHICYTPEDVEAHKLIGWVPLEEAKPEQKRSHPGWLVYAEPERKKPGRKPKVKHEPE